MDHRRVVFDITRLSIDKSRLVFDNSTVVSDKERLIFYISTVEWHSTVFYKRRVVFDIRRVVQFMIYRIG
jgi:hypothetical protein